MNNDVLTVKGFLVVRASGEMRIMKKRYPLRLDEVSFPITVSIPRQWGRVQATTIELVMPEPPEAVVTVESGEVATVEAV
jgi:hypothetical protein